MAGGIQSGRTGQAKRVSNASIFAGCAVFVFGMVGAAYAAVPLYRLFCQVTGYGGTTQRVEQYSTTVLDRTVQVTFDANISSGLNWDFRAAKAVQPKIGRGIRFAPHIGYGSGVFNSCFGGPACARSHARYSRRPARCGRS